MSGAKLGDKNYLFGKSLPEETCNKISEALKGRIISSTTKEKLSIANGNTIFVYSINNGVVVLLFHPLGQLLNILFLMLLRF